MVWDIFRITGIALIGISAALIVKATRPEIAVHISIITGAVILLYSISLIEGFRSQAQAFVVKYGIDPTGFKAALKITGIAYIAQFAADTCRDCGENAIACKVELAGRIMIIVTAFPLIISTVEAIGAIIAK